MTTPSHPTTIEAVPAPKIKRKANPRHHGVLKHLPTLPRELLHQVLDDLGLVTILELLCRNEVPYLDEAVKTHIKWGKLLPSDKLDELKHWFTLYVQIRGNDHRNHELAISIGKRSSFPKILLEVKQHVLHWLRRYASVAAQLQPYAPGMLSNTEDLNALDFDGCKQLWETFDAAEKNLNAAKAEQIRFIIRLLKTYPGWLKDTKDPTQERHGNVEHRIQRYEALAERSLEFKISARPEPGLDVGLRVRYDNEPGHWVGGYWFETGRVPVAPYDFLLRLFLKTLERFPVEDHVAVGEPNLDLEQLRLTEKEKVREPKKKLETIDYTYTPEALGHIRTAIAGLKCVYTTQETRDRLQSLNPQWSRVIVAKYKGFGPGQRQTKFVVPDGPRLPYEKRGLPLPLDQRELEWLEAFLESCRFMAQWDQEWKSKGMTVAEYWKLHNGGFDAAR
jgi:hypothetical protein